MKISDSYSYPGADLGCVFAMLTNRDFQRLKCEATLALSYTVDISGEPGAPVVSTRRRLPTDRLPDFVRAMVRDGIEIIETITWEAAGADGRREAAVALSFPGQPIRMTGTLELRSEDGGTLGALVADLRAAVPLVGGRIEKATAPLISQAMAIEERLGQVWLDKLASG
jgi:hypothetical protein